jgi:hypothetical protein
MAELVEVKMMLKLEQASTSGTIRCKRLATDKWKEYVPNFLTKKRGIVNFLMLDCNDDGAVACC